MHGGIVVIDMSLNVEEDNARLAIANYQLKWLTRMDFFDNQLV